MSRDLEARLRRAAEILDGESTARVHVPSSNPAPSGSDGPDRRPRRRWFAVAAAACLAAVGGGVLVIQSQRDSSSPTPPTDTTPGDGLFEEGWNELPAAPIGPRIAHATVPTDSGILVWGGAGTGGALRATGPMKTLGDGAFLDLTTGEWQKTPEFPFDGTVGTATGTWTGDHVVLVTQRLPEGTSLDDIRRADESGGDVELDAVAASYDPASNRWKALPSPPLRGASVWMRTVAVATESHVVVVDTSATAVTGETCAVGGSDASSAGRDFEPEDCVEDTDHGPNASVAVFDLTTRSWSRGSAPPDGSALIPVGSSVGDEVVTVGNGDPGGSDCSAAMYRYAPATDTWRSVEARRDEPTLAGLTWTGEALFTGMPSACSYAGASESTSSSSDDGVTAPTVMVAPTSYLPRPNRSAQGSWTNPANQHNENVGTVPPAGDRAEPLGRLTSLDGSLDTTFPAPKYVDSLTGWWTGSAVAVVGDDGLPMFYDVATGDWHEAPPTELRPAPARRSAMDSYLGPQFVWADGAMVAWSGVDLAEPLVERNGEQTANLVDGGLVYVPPARFAGD